MIYKVFITSFLLIFVNLTSLFSQDSLNIENVKKNPETKLPAIEINGGYFSPVEGVDISVAKEIIITELTKKDEKGKKGRKGKKDDISPILKITEITTKESWQNMGVQIYHFEQAFLDGVAIIRDKNVLTILYGMPTKTFFLADLDKDSIYEIYTNYFMGFGIISEEIVGYNIYLNEHYSLSMRMENDLHLYISDGILMTEVRPYSKLKEKPAIKKVNLKMIDNKYKIIIE